MAVSGKAKNKKFHRGGFRRMVFLSYLLIAVLGIVLTFIRMTLNLSHNVELLMMGGYLFIVLAAAAYMTVMIMKPLHKISHAIGEMRLGHMSVRCNVKSRNEIGELAAKLDDYFEIIQNSVVGTIGKIAAGKVDDVQFKAEDDQDEIAPVVLHLVDTMQSLAGDLRAMIDAAQAGDLTVRCDTSRYEGSWQSLTGNMNHLLDSVLQPVNDVMAIMSDFAVNNYTRKLDADSYQGSFRTLAGNVNDVHDNMLNMQGAIVRVAQGDTSRLEQFRAMGKKSEQDFMVPSIVRLMETINALVEEMSRLTGESANGRFEGIRGDADKFEGIFRQVVTGMNDTLAAITAPVHEAAEVLTAMSVNDFTKTIGEGVCKGDFVRLADAIGELRRHMVELQTSAVKIADGDISDLERFRSIGRRSESDLLTPAFTKMMEAIRGLITETTAIAQAVTEGNLGYEIQDAGFEGEFQTIIRGFQDAFTAMKAPLTEISSVMKQTASGNIRMRITGEYQGGFSEIAADINETLNGLGDMVRQISQTLTEISGGHLNIDPVESFPGDWKDISESINTILGSFNELLAGISIAASQVAAGSTQVYEGSQNLSQGSTEQASSVEELTSSISQISVKTRDNAHNAAEANRLAIAAKGNAETGTQQMQDMLTSMNDINSSAANISKIIKVIDDIAFQTNILALNAAVEAARAGQYGRGFAVVAEEVRNLAARSANAAKDTTELIEGTTGKISNGSKLANDTATALSTIVSSVDKMASLISNIAAASDEQASGLAQIDKGIEVVSNVVQTNSATSEQSAAASGELSSQANHLSEMLAKFTLRSSDE